MIDIDVTKFDALAKALGWENRVLVFTLLGAEDPWARQDPPGRWLVGFGSSEHSRYGGGVTLNVPSDKRTFSDKESDFHGLGETPKAALKDIADGCEEPRLRAAQALGAS